jgi:hypothetical protein
MSKALTVLLPLLVPSTATAQEVHRLGDLLSERYEIKTSDGGYLFLQKENKVYLCSSPLNEEIPSNIEYKSMHNK